jgi:hypothetical protein
MTSRKYPPSALLRDTTDDQKGQGGSARSGTSRPNFSTECVPSPRPPRTLPVQRARHPPPCSPVANARRYSACMTRPDDQASGGPCRVRASPRSASPLPRPPIQPTCNARGALLPRRRRRDAPVLSLRGILTIKPTGYRTPLPRGQKARGLNLPLSCPPPAPAPAAAPSTPSATQCARRPRPPRRER